jgi:hypothetical protein
LRTGATTKIVREYNPRYQIHYRVYRLESPFLAACFGCRNSEF